MALGKPWGWCYVRGDSTRNRTARLHLESMSTHHNQDRMGMSEQPPDNKSPHDLFRHDTDDWLDSIQPTSRDGYRRAITEWADWCHTAGVNPYEARPADINRWRNHIAKRPCPSCRAGNLSDLTVAKRVSAVCSCYDWLAADGRITVSPTHGVRRPPVDNTIARGRQLSAAERDAILDAARAAPDPTGRTRAITETLAILGLRVGELVSLQVGSLQTEGEAWVLRFRGKGGRAHIRGVPEPQAELLRSYLAARAAAAGTTPDRMDGPMFTTATGTPLTRQQVWDMVQRLARRAGVRRPVGTHSFRSTYVADLRKAGVDLHTIQESLGHARAETTRRYDRSAAKLADDPAYILDRIRRGPGGDT